MGQDVRDESRVCRTPPGPPKDLNQLLRPRTIFMAVSLTLILTTAGLVVLQPPPKIPLPPDPPPTPLQLTPHGNITIDGDANFSATALLEGWPGDGSPENPFIIDGLDIDLGGEFGNCISISNTRFSFTISNCNLNLPGTGLADAMPPPGAIINLENVTNGELVNNTCNSNGAGADFPMNRAGIALTNSNHNTVVNNTCTSNAFGIYLMGSDSNTVANNICNNNSWGIIFGHPHWHALEGCSESNTVANNTCNNNEGPGISLGVSDANTVANNTCSWNGEGISLVLSGSNTVANNTCSSNDESGISLSSSQSNTVSHNTCTSNSIGISLEYSDSNTIANNICNSNGIGIYLDRSDSNTVTNNTCVGNTEHDIVGEYITEEDGTEEFVAENFVWFLAGCGMILAVSVIAFVQFRRMEI